MLRSELTECSMYDIVLLFKKKHPQPVFGLLVHLSICFMSVSRCFHIGWQVQMDMEPESESHVEAQGAKVHSALEDQAPHIGHLEVKGPKGRNRSNRIKSVSLKTCFGWSHVWCRSFWFGELNMHIPTVTYSQLKSSHDKSSKNHQRIIKETMRNCVQNVLQLVVHQYHNTQLSAELPLRRSCETRWETLMELLQETPLALFKTNFIETSGNIWKHIHVCFHGEIWINSWYRSEVETADQSWKT